MSESKVCGTLAARIEQAVRDVFEKRFAGRSLPYEQARDLVWLERGVVEHVIWSLSVPVATGDCRDDAKEPTP